MLILAYCGLSVKEDLTRSKTFLTSDQIEHRAFATATGSDNADKLTFLNAKCDLPKYLELFDWLWNVFDIDRNSRSELEAPPRPDSERLDSTGISPQ